METSSIFRLAEIGTGQQLRSEIRRRKPKHVDDIRKSRPGSGIAKETEKGLTLLLAACQGANVEAVKVLLELGASVEEVTPADELYVDINFDVECDIAIGEETAVHLAAQEDSAAIIKLLQAAGANVNVLSRNGSTPLMYTMFRYPKTLSSTTRLGKAAMKEYKFSEPAAAKLLIESGANMDMKSKEIHRTTMHYYKLVPGSIFMKRMGYAGRVSSGLSALHLAVNTGDYGIVKCLVQAGADIDAQTNQQSICDRRQTPLHFAVEFGEKEMVSLLLEAGASVNAADEIGVTPFHQLFAIDEELLITWSRWNSSLYEGTETVQELKEDRLAMAKILLQAGANRHARFIVALDHSQIGGEGNGETQDIKTEDIHDLIQLNLDSGGREIEEMMSTIWAQPRSLQSSCRLVIRKQLSRPILLSDNVDKLPLPMKAKSYIAMETLEFIT